MVAQSKKVSDGIASSVTTSRRARPSMSGQYSSSMPAGGAPDKNLTGLPRLADNFASIFLSPVEMLLPSGNVIRAGGNAPDSSGGWVNAARKENNAGHLAGFFALAIFPDAGSATENTRSPSTPLVPICAAFNSSPIMDLTGWR